MLLSNCFFVDLVFELIPCPSCYPDSVPPPLPAAFYPEEPLTPTRSANGAPGQSVTPRRAIHTPAPNWPASFGPGHERAKKRQRVQEYLAYLDNPLDMEDPMEMEITGTTTEESEDGITDEMAEDASSYVALARRAMEGGNHTSDSEDTATGANSSTAPSLVATGDEEADDSDIAADPDELLKTLRKVAQDQRRKRRRALKAQCHQDQDS